MRLWGSRGLLRGFTRLAVGNRGGRGRGATEAAFDAGVAYYDVQIDMLNAPLSGIPEDDLELA